MVLIKIIETEIENSIINLNMQPVQQFKIRMYVKSVILGSKLTNTNSRDLTSTDLIKVSKLIDKTIIGLNTAETDPKIKQAVFRLLIYYLSKLVHLKWQI